MVNFSSHLTMQVKRVGNSPKQATQVRIAQQSCPSNSTRLINICMEKKFLQPLPARLTVCLKRTQQWLRLRSVSKVQFKPTIINKNLSTHSNRLWLRSLTHAHTHTHTYTFKTDINSALNNFNFQLLSQSSLRLQNKYTQV